MLVELAKETCIVIGSSKEETVVYVAFLCRYAELLVESLQGCGLRHRIGHIKKAGNTTCCSRTTFTLDVGFLRQPWLTEMHVVINDAWQYKTSRSIDDLIKRCFGMVVSCDYFCYLTVIDNDGAVECPSFIDNGSPLYERSHSFGRLVSGACNESGARCGATEGAIVEGASCGTSLSIRPF